MQNNYLLALDLGTSSIGYVVFSIDDNEHPDSVLDAGVRIFSDGRNPKTKEPLAVARRKARGIRRNRDRGQNRVRRLVRELIEAGLLPANESERKTVFKTCCPYECRYLSANKPVDSHTLGRALFHLGRRRGFKSNRLSNSDEESEFKSKIAELKAQLKGQTLGEYLYQKLEQNKALVTEKRLTEQQVVRFRGGETAFYADRQMYLDEFEKIKQTQGHQLLNEEQWQMLKETIFWQYPLRPVPKGKCRFFPEESRAHLDLPLTHQFRIWQEINALRYTVDGVEHVLDKRQRTALYQLLNQQKTLSFKSLIKKKDPHNSPLFPGNAVFDLDTQGRGGKLLGNKVLIDLRAPDLLGKLADELPGATLNEVVHYLIEPLKEVRGRQAVVEQKEMTQWLKQALPALTTDQIQRLINYNKFKRGTSSVSRKFMERIVPVLQDTGMVYSEAVQYVSNDDGEALHHSSFAQQNFDKLPYYGVAMPESVWGEQPEADQNKAPNERDENAFHYGKIANPTVHVALNQLRHVVNQLIDKHGGKPGRIHVELTRDLKNSREARERINKKIAQNNKTNNRIKKFLAEEFGYENPGREDLQKVLLWEELGKQGSRRCVFTNQPISVCNLFNGEVEIEHIIPFSRCYDDGMGNKTLAFKSVNNRKLNRTPDEAFEGEEYNAIVNRAYRAFGNSAKYKRFLTGAYDEFYGDEKGTLIERQLNDTRYISKKAVQYLSCICDRNKIVTVNGQMTAVLRNVWNLNRYKDKEEGHYRDDHRHHTVDAFVVGLTSRRLVQTLMTRTARSGYHPRSLYHFLKERAPNIDQLKAQLYRKLETVNASHKQDHATLGSMFNETAYGLAQDDNGADVCVTRKAVSSLSYEEVFRVRGRTYRSTLIDFLMQGEPVDTYALKIGECTKLLKAKAGNEKQLAERLQTFADHYAIKMLRVNVYNASVKPLKSAPYKGYALNEYAYCDIWQIPDKQDKHSGKWSYRYQGAYVTFAEISQYAQHPKRPLDEKGRSHPAAKRLMRLYKQDNITLTNKQNETIQILRVAGFSSTNNKLDLQKNLFAGKASQNHKSINACFQENTVRKIRG